MSAYIEPIRFAFLTFPFIAFLFTLPYIFHQYHKYGSVLFFRVTIIYSFILYLTCIYFLVILPLPSIESVRNMTTEWVQLVPFAFIRDFVLKSSFIWDDPSTYLEVLKEPYFYQAFYNILLTLPFGIYLRYYFNCSFKKTFFCTFLLTLFFELTQLSGLYGIYPRPYRLFDVDDLFLNTLGGIIGYAITPIFSHFLPNREKLDTLSYIKGKRISVLRRGMAVWIDLFLVSLLTTLFVMLGVENIFLQYVFSVIVIFMIVPTIRKGYTCGKKWMNIKIVTINDEVPCWYQYFIRYGILYLFLLPAPYYFIFFVSLLNHLSRHLKLVFWMVVLGFIVFAFVMFVHFLITLFTKKLFWYEKLSATKNSSTIEVEKCEEL